MFYLIPLPGLLKPWNYTVITETSNIHASLLRINLNIFLDELRCYLFKVHRLVRSNINNIATESLQAAGMLSSAVETFPALFKMQSNVGTQNSLLVFYLLEIMWILLLTSHFPDAIRNVCSFHTQCFVHLIHSCHCKFFKPFFSPSIFGLQHKQMKPTSDTFSNLIKVL